MGDGVLQVTGSRDLDLVNDAPQGASRRRRIQGVIWNLQRDNILMELYRERKPMEKGYAERLYQAWNAKMPDHKTTKVALTTRISRIRRDQGLLRLNLVEPDSCGLATLTETVEEGVGAQRQGELHQVQAVTEQNGELPAAPVEAPTNDHPSPRTSGNDQLMQLLGKAKDACLRKKPGDFSDRKPCGAVRFNHGDTALLQEANDLVEKEWQEGPRLAWHLNCLVYSVAMAVRGKTTYESQPCNQGRKSHNQKGSKRQEGHISDRKAKSLRFRRLLAWLDVEIARQQSNTVGKVNKDDPGVKEWLKETKKRLGRTSSEGPDSIDETKLRKALKKAKSWSAPGPDGIHTFWWKALPSAQSALADVLRRVVSGDLSVPDWLTRGCTLLIPKKGDPKSAANYRPIACLNTMYKAVTAYIASELLTYTYTNDLLPMAQRAMRKGRWGCVDCLLLDQSIGLDAKIMGKPLSVAWIDYEKAYDRVPHKWVMKVLKIIKCPGWIWRSIELFSKHWATVFQLRTAGKVARSTPVKYNRGLFQGDSLSPLLYCLAIAPISQVLNRTKGYTLWHNWERNTMSHLLYMDDLKIYAGGPDKLREAMECVEKTSNAIGMRFGVRKCGTAHMQKGKFWLAQTTLNAVKNP